MKRSELLFTRPEKLAATAPPETRGLLRDEVRLLVSTPGGHTHARFLDLADFLEPGDLLVVNESATLPASLPAQSSLGKFILNLSTNYGNHLWLAEPRWGFDRPGPLPFIPGESIQAAGLPARLVAPYPGLPRLWFVRFKGDLQPAMRKFGRPIVYGYIEKPPGLEYYQTIFATTPGSAEMPSAARPFTRRVLNKLDIHGVRLADIVLHTGVSSLEVEAEVVEEQPLYPEPFWIPARTARLVNDTRQAGGRVLAVGTTVVRALESAWESGRVRSVAGFTRLYIHPGRGVNAIDGLLTGLHDPVTSHLAMLYTLGGQEMIQAAYAEALEEGYLWHEFGDSHLILNP